MTAKLTVFFTSVDADQKGRHKFLGCPTTTINNLSEVQNAVNELMDDMGIVGVEVHSFKLTIQGTGELL